MAGTLTVAFVASASSLQIGSRFFGDPKEIATLDFQNREPVAWSAANEFLVNGTTSGNVSITAA